MNGPGQHLLIDADDTLWENNIYFERAFHRFCEFLDHSELTNQQVRAALDEVELVNNRLHGYGSANFGRNMVECYHHLVERAISSSDAETILGFATAIQEHPLEIIGGVPETLEYLTRRHDLILFTKGNPLEQTRKIERSGLAAFFNHTIVVREKDTATYRRIAQERSLPPDSSWMIGNSPKSDINPALDAGLGAVYVPHDRTWHLEREEIRQGARLLVVETFAGLVNYF